MTQCLFENEENIEILGRKNLYEVEKIQFGNDDNYCHEPEVKLSQLLYLFSESGDENISKITAVPKSNSDYTELRNYSTLQSRLTDWCTFDDDTLKDSETFERLDSDEEFISEFEQFQINSQIIDNTIVDKDCYSRRPFCGIRGYSDISPQLHSSNVCDKNNITSISGRCTYNKEYGDYLENCYFRKDAEEYSRNIPITEENRRKLFHAEEENQYTNQMSKKSNNYCVDFRTNKDCLCKGCNNWMGCNIDCSQMKCKYSPDYIPKIGVLPKIKSVDRHEGIHKYRSNSSINEGSKPCCSVYFDNSAECCRNEPQSPDDSTNYRYCDCEELCDSQQQKRRIDNNGSNRFCAPSIGDSRSNCKLSSTKRFHRRVSI